MRSYGNPFKLYLVKLEDGSRRQMADEEKARALAAEIRGRTGKPLDEILVPSRFWYVRLYLGAGKEKRVNTRQKTRPDALKWIRERSRRGTTGPRKETVSQAVEGWLKHHDACSERK